MILHSDLRRRAASRRALPCPSSYYYYYYYYLHCSFQPHPNQFFYRAKLRVAWYCQGKLSVRPSLTLRYRDHIGWNSAKIISELSSLTISLSADLNMADLLQREHHQILAEIGVWKIVDFRHLSRRISETVQERSKLLLTTNTRFRLVPKSMTLDDL